MNSVVVGALIKHLANENPAVFGVCQETLTRYRKMIGITGVHYVSQHQAELLIAALMFRPASNTDLAKSWGQNRDNIRSWLIRGLDSDSIEITENVKGEDLQTVILQATGINIRSIDTLENYARELSIRCGQQIRFRKSLVYSPEIATGFARMAIEKRYARKKSGYETAFKRWGYVPDVQLQAV